MKEDFTNADRLSLITEMIRQAKSNVAKGGSFYFLLWGWVIATCNILHYVLWKFQLSDTPYVVWLLVIPTAIASVVYGIRKRMKSGVKSHIDQLYGLIWLGVIISAIFVIYFVNDMRSANGIILIFSALGTFLSGCVLRFTPSIIGGVVLWIAGLVCFQLELMDQYLLAGIAIIIGYIIPGYMLRKSEKSRV